jgi:predicted transcriptional regulator
MGAQESLLEMAVRLNASGRRVFPVRDKKPCIGGYHGHEPFSESELKAMANWSNVNSLGWAIDPMCVVLDIDSKGNYLGYDQLQYLEEQHGPLPLTAKQETPSGGCHLIFKLTEEQQELIIREVQKFRSNLEWDGIQQPSIDICHAKNRFLNIYEPEFLEQDFADLPRQWFESLAAPIRQPQRALGAPSLPRGLDGVKQAPVGLRNQTLYGEVKTLSSLDEFGDREFRQFQEEARKIGLADSEILKTMDSAREAGHIIRAEHDLWLKSTWQTLEKVGLRNRKNIYTTARVLSRFDIEYGPRFAVSVRQLSEIIPYGRTTACKHLNLLQDLNIITRVSNGIQTGNSSEYELVGLQLGKVDTLNTCTYRTNTRESGGVSKLLPLQARNELFSHDAFLGVGPGRSLPISCAHVLQSIMDGADDVQGIHDATQYSKDTVRDCLHKLESVGVVRYSSRSTKKVGLTTKDLNKSLDEWAEWSGAAGKRERQSQQHKGERQKVRNKSTRLRRKGTQITH